MVKFISSITSSLLLLLLLWPGESWGQTTIRGGGSDNVAEVSGSALSGTEKGLVIRCASGCAGSGGTSQADNSAVSSLTGIGALYDTTPPAITDGNVGLPVMDSSRRLIVNCGSGCSGSSFADNAAFTFGTTTIQPIAGVFDDVGSNTASENSAAVVRITTNKGLHANLRNASGTEIGTAGAPVRTDPTGTTAQPVTNTGTFATQAAQSGTWTVQPGNTANTTPWLATISQGGNAAAVNASGQLSITCANCSGSGASAVDDAAFTVATGSGAPAMGLFDDVAPDSVNEGDAGVLRMSANRALYVNIRDNAGNERGLNIDASGNLSANQAGTWNITDISGTISLPTGAATAAKQPALGAAGTASTDVITVQGIASMTALKVDGSAVTQPVSMATNTPVGNVAHDAADSGAPLKVGAKAIAHGTNPTAVAAADRTDLYANRAGILFTIGGHPNSKTIEAQIEDADGAQTNAALITVSAGTKIGVTRLSMTCDTGNTGPINAVVGFGTATLPARAHTGAVGILHGFDGMPAGGGITIGDGSGILGIGADDEDVRLTMEDPAGGSCTVSLTYFTIES